MLVAKLPSIAMMALASLLAGGCYCPMLSGRYCELGRCPPCGLPTPAPTDDSNCGCESSHEHGPYLRGAPFGVGGRLGLRQAALQVPSQQGPDYISPQARFHPVPTRPVFESQLAYPPLELIEPASHNPLRPAVMIHGR